MTTRILPDHEAQPYSHLSSRQLIDVLLLYVERPQIHPHVTARTIDPLRAELRRREALGFDDPFESPYPEVTW